VIIQVETSDFSLCRAAEVHSVVATQSNIQSQGSTAQEGVEDPVQAFRTKVFLSTADRIQPAMHRSCAARWTGRASATPFPNHPTTPMSDGCRSHFIQQRVRVCFQAVPEAQEPLFEENVFFDLKNAQSVIVAFDGVSPLPPTYCYLKLDFLPVTMTWFDQERIRFNPRRLRAMSFDIIIPFLKPIQHCSNPKPSPRLW